MVVDDASDPVTVDDTSPSATGSVRGSVASVVEEVAGSVSVDVTSPSVVVKVSGTVTGSVASAVAEVAGSVAGTVSSDCVSTVVDDAELDSGNVVVSVTEVVTLESVLEEKDSVTTEMIVVFAPTAVWVFELVESGRADEVTDWLDIGVPVVVGTDDDAETFKSRFATIGDELS